MTLAQFDDEYEVVYRSIALEQVPPLELSPRGRTALLDSMGKLIMDTTAEINALADAEKPGTVVVAIMTDGVENTSRELPARGGRPSRNALATSARTHSPWSPPRFRPVARPAPVGDPRL